MSTKQQTASRWLNSRLHTAKVPYAIASVFTLLSVGSFVIFCHLIASYVDLWLSHDIIESKLLVQALFALAGRYVFAMFESVSNYRAGNLITSQIKEKLYPVLLTDNQLDSTSSAMYITKICDDLKSYYAFFIPYSLATVLVSISLLIVTFMVEKWVAIILLIALIVIPFQMIVVGIGAETIHKKHTNLFLKYSSVFHNRLNSIVEIMNLDNFSSQYAFLSKKSAQLNKATVNVMKVAILSSAILELFVTISIAAVAIYLGMSLLGIMPGPNYGIGYDFRKSLFLLTLTPYFFFYLRKFVSAYHDRNRAIASADLIMPLLQRKEPHIDADLSESLHSITISNLDFAYPNSPVLVLDNISQQFPAKGLVLVKGISGSGKSTLLKILTGTLSSQHGKVSVNGHDNDWSREWLKHNTSYMNQFPFIFDGTIEYNVLLEEDRTYVSHKTQTLPDFLIPIIAKKAGGRHSVLSHNGQQLSGGEKQLITLARMLLHPRQVAILDEPTANLDENTVQTIIDQITDIAEQQLVIVASHEPRFDSVAHLTIELNWGKQMPEQQTDNTN